ncbi:MAG: pilus assembly PilX family protein [Cellvibrionaceae bacterium]
MVTKRKYQQGVVIIIALVMLLVMTAVGVTLMSGATLQERMAGSSRQLSIARINAEAALRQAETVMDNMNIRTREDVSLQFDGPGDGRYVGVRDLGERSGFDELDIDLSEPESWTSTNSVAAAATATSATLPRYAIEYIGRLSIRGSSQGIDISKGAPDKPNTDPFVFRITAIGYGADDNLTAVLQSIYSTASR